MKRCKPAGWAGFYGFKNGAPLRIFLDRHSHIEQEARRYAEDELAEYARQAAQAIEHAEQRQGRESLLAVADTLAAIRDVLDKVPLSDLAIPVVTDIIFRAAQLLTLDLDLDEARAAHRQIVEAHVNATNPAHADYDALQQAGEARRRASGQAGEAVGGLLRLSFFAIGAAFGTAASGGARRREARVSQRAAKTPKGQPKKQSPPQRVVDNQKRIQENWQRAEGPSTAAVRAPWGRRIRQRSDIDWDFVRPEGTRLAGQTNRDAARQGYSPVRINPQTGKVDDVVLHHALDDPRGTVIETWRSSHTRFHNTMGREPNPWRQERPDWAQAWQNEQSAYWRWRTGAYNPPPQPRLRLPGDAH